MARGRMISKSLSTSERFAALHESAGKLAEFCQSLYPLLLAHADDWGCQQGDPFTIKHAVFPTSPRRLPEFTTALKKHDLLEQNQAEIKLASGETLNLNGFLTVSAKKFDELSDDLYLEFRRKGWIGLIHLHLASVLNWERLVALTSRQ